MEESKIRKLIIKHSVEYHECSKKGIYVNELYVDEFTDELVYELNQERAKANVEQSASNCNLHIVMPSVIHTKRMYDVIWDTDHVDKGKTGNFVISIINSRGHKIKEIREL